MSDVIEVLKLLGSAVQNLLRASRDQKAEVARHFLNLSKTFNSFPSAHKAKDFNEMMRLAAKTHGQLDSLRQTEVFTKVLGPDAERFFQTIEDVSNAKDLMAQEPGSGRLTEIINAAGYFEGFYETLSAEHAVRDEK